MMEVNKMLQCCNAWLYIFFCDISSRPGLFTSSDTFLSWKNPGKKNKIKCVDRFHFCLLK